MHGQRIDTEKTAEFVDVKEENDEDAWVHVDEGRYASKVCQRRYCRCSFGMEPCERS